MLEGPFHKLTHLSALVTQPFSDLFPPKPLVPDAVLEAMTTYGYDQSRPILVWDEGQVIIDGHTRLKAAQEAGIEDVPVHYKSFETEDEALAYAIHLQRNRRNLTNAEIIRCIEALDKRREIKRDEKGKFTGASNEALGKSAKETAKVVGVSRAKVERARTVLEHADPEVKEAVRAGEMSINRAYQQTQEVRRAQETGKPVFNRTNENIEWASWTWNPVTGCEHGCPHCYARDITRRFASNGAFEPKFQPARLAAPANGFANTRKGLGDNPESKKPCNDPITW